MAGVDELARMLPSFKQQSGKLAQLEGRRTGTEPERLGVDYQTHVDSQLRHHDPFFAGDAASLRERMKDNHRQYPNKILDVQRTIAEGPLVAVHSKIRMTADDNGAALIHLFRFHDSKIVEMWSVGQPVPKDSVNQHGMF